MRTLFTGSPHYVNQLYCQYTVSVLRRASCNSATASMGIVTSQLTSQTRSASINTVQHTDGYRNWSIKRTFLYVRSLCIHIYLHLLLLHVKMILLAFVCMVSVSSCLGQTTAPATTTPPQPSFPTQAGTNSTTQQVTSQPSMQSTVSQGTTLAPNGE